MVPTGLLIAWFSAMVVLKRVMMSARFAGPSGTSVTVIVIDFSKVFSPWSVARTRIE